MIKTPTLLLAALMFFQFCIAQTNADTLKKSTYWQQQVDYAMEVTLHPSDNSLDGFATIQYHNQSPDTLTFLWVHLWPNAFKNDRTAFSDQLLINGDTRFYFSNPEQKGYINRLDFRISGNTIATEDHPEHIDIVKVILPKKLYPGETTTITTPFHVKLPQNFSRGGYNGKTYQLTQWYPKIAVYDAKGWHPIPYLDQGEFYNDFGNYKVKITAPKPFVIAATGIPQQPVSGSLQLPTLKPRKNNLLQPKERDWKKVPLQTYTYSQKNVTDFAWFADTAFSVLTDSLQLPSKKWVKMQCYFHFTSFPVWENSIEFIKNAIQYHTKWIGEYPYNVVTIVEGEQGFQGGMEYPTITILTGAKTPQELDLLIFHEVGHNWMQGILSTNERTHPWMDEGMNTFYENRYKALRYPDNAKRIGIDGLISDARFPELLAINQVATHQDYPIDSPSDQFTASNYSMMVYTKASSWMKYLETFMGISTFDSAMKAYYQQWKFKHPQPLDFKHSLETSSGIKLDQAFTLLSKKGKLPQWNNKPYKIIPFFGFKAMYDYKPIFVMPVAAYNSFNGFMVGIAFHNFALPVPKLTFAAIPLVGLKSKELNGAGRLAYRWNPTGIFDKIELAVSGTSIVQSEYKDSTRHFSLGNRRFSPSILLQWKENNPLSTVSKFIQLKYFAIEEDALRYRRDSSMPTNYDITKNTSGYSLSQLRLVWQNTRVLYPYKSEWLSEFNKDFVRLSYTGNYFFNFVKKGGLNVRLFAGKFIYTAPKTLSTSFQTDRFHLNMSGPKGYEDYTYSNYFTGRRAFEGISSQQIMIRDGGFKVRTDLLSEKVGKTDNWLAALNFTMDVPDRLNPLQALPIKIPLKLFADIGTNNKGFTNVNEGQPKFLFDGGLQISLLNNLVNFYFPLVYSSVYGDYYKSVPGNKFLQRMSFSINIQDFNIQEIKKSLGL
jgi:hypothetical protein